MGRVSAISITKDNRGVVYAVNTPDVDQNKTFVNFISLKDGSEKLLLKAIS
jgi:hypothetical protein